jgi:hypothetical protein
VAPFTYVYESTGPSTLRFAEQVGNQPPPLVSEIDEPTDVVFRVLIVDARGLWSVLSEQFVVTYAPKAAAP